MEKALYETKISPAKVPLIANILADGITQPDHIINCLIEQISGMVRWRESVLALKELGVSNITEIGAGKVLNGMNKRIDSGFTLSNIQSVSDIKSIIA